MLAILELIRNKCIHDELIHMYTRISGHTWISGKMVQILGREHEKLSINKMGINKFARKRNHKLRINTRRNLVTNNKIHLS